MKCVLTNAALWAGLAACFVAGSAQEAQADYGYGGRQYYSSWSYYPSSRYYYRTYYYKPYTEYRGYQYHYCVHYPSQPRYVYYYNPHKKVYWGRFDMEGKPGQQYSILAEKDRQEKLEDIPESAFPKPAQMPVIPEAKDDVQIAPFTDLPEKDLPK